MRERDAPLLITICCNELKKAGQDLSVLLDEHRQNGSRKLSIATHTSASALSRQVVEKEHKLPVKHVNI